jgi:hypothetical protein
VGAVRTLAVASVAGRWTSQLPPRSWTVTGPDPRGVPAAAAPPGEPGGSTLVALASPSERSRPRRTRRTGTEVPAGFASRGLARVCPFAVLPARGRVTERCVHSRRRRSAEAGDVAIGVGFPGPTSCSALVVSHHLDGLLRTVAAGLLHPAPGLGVRRVAGRPSPATARIRRSEGPAPERPFPRRGHPSKGSPRQQPCRITAVVASLPLPRARPPGPKPRVPKRPKARPAAHEAPARIRAPRRTDSVGRCRRNRSSDSAGVTPLNPHVVSARWNRT